MSIKNNNIDHSKFLVSIVTITYNHQKYIINTIEGVLMQEYRGPIEFIIANDNSQDNTDKIIHQYLNKRTIPSNIEIKYRCHEENKGVSSNFIWALKQAKGKYIALCEGDDYWTDPLKLRKQVEFLEKNRDYSLCVGGFTEFNVYTKETKDILIVPKKAIDNFGYSFTLADTKTWITKTLTAVFRNEKNILKQLEQYQFTRDTHLFYHILKTGRGYYFNSIFGVYNIHEGGVNSMKKGAVNTLASYRIYKELYEYNNDSFSKYMFFRSSLNLLNLKLYERNNIHFIRTQILLKDTVCLMTTFKDILFLVRSLIPNKLVAIIKRILKRRSNITLSK